MCFKLCGVYNHGHCTKKELRHKKPKIIPCYSAFLSKVRTFRGEDGKFCSGRFSVKFQVHFGFVIVRSNKLELFMSSPIMNLRVLWMWLWTQIILNQFLVIFLNKFVWFKKYLRKITHFRELLFFESHNWTFFGQTFQHLCWKFQAIFPKLESTNIFSCSDFNLLQYFFWG